jgi:hypothetical protein
VLALWKNSPRIDMSPHSNILSWFWANQSLLSLLNAACFGLNRLGLEIHHTQGKLTNHYSTDAVILSWKQNKLILIYYKHCIIHIGVSVSASSCPSIFSDKNSLSEEYTTHRYHIQQELINDLTCYMYWVLCDSPLFEKFPHTKGHFLQNLEIKKKFVFYLLKLPWKISF